MSSYAGVPPERLNQLFDRLAAEDLIIDSEIPNWIDSLLATWRSYGWSEAADYHLASYDYEFHDYSSKGRDQDREAMLGYIDEQEDHLRYKTTSGNGVTYQAPTALDSIQKLQPTLHESLCRSPEGAACDRDSIQSIMAIAFGQIGSYGRDVPGKYRPLIRRTSPSGGSRHPTEGYVRIIDVPGMEPGWYHFSMEKNELIKVSDEGDIPVKRIMPGIFRADFPVKAVIVMTSQFERNMYRYREPRTFRSIFMDVGHITATIEASSHAIGLRAFAQHGVSDSKVEEILNLEPLKEGVLFAVGIGDGIRNGEQK
ncbi:SagB/ThcOx family dehydrogenase [Nocardiopsis sp. NPDC006938]|uniref:SagB/ThcOx family dehydrogenase n=1 Tax=Nocardiopsis sp. NPDC006938 TaxID=3364337 RepID=UPI00367C2DF3